MNNAPETDLAARMAATSDKRAAVIRALAVTLGGPALSDTGRVLRAREALGLSNITPHSDNLRKVEDTICEALGLT